MRSGVLHISCFGILLMALVLATGCDTFGRNEIIDESDEGIPVPFQRISMAGMDRVSYGGDFQAVVRTQEEYDQIIYERFQKPLDDYWNEHYESTRQWVVEQNPGLSEAEIEERVRDAFYNALPFYGTENVKHPDIDFSRHTLLGQAAHTAGCSADWEAGVTKKDDTYTFRILVTSIGSCEMAISRNFWGLIPRIDDTSTVVFEVVERKQ